MSLFQSIGLSEAKAKDTIKNAAVSSALKSLVLEVSFSILHHCIALTSFLLPQTRDKLGSEPISKVVGNLLYHIATRFKGSGSRASMLLDYVSTGKLVTEQQLSGKV